jgi:hypothetical protein
MGNLFNQFGEIFTRASLEFILLRVHDYQERIRALANTSDRAAKVFRIQRREAFIEND